MGPHGRDRQIDSAHFRAGPNLDGGCLSLIRSTREVRRHECFLSIRTAFGFFQYGADRIRNGKTRYRRSIKDSDHQPVSVLRSVTAGKRPRDVLTRIRFGADEIGTWREPE